MEPTSPRRDYHIITVRGDELSLETQIAEPSDRE
jgi:hypothetical protein